MGDDDEITADEALLASLKELNGRVDWHFLKEQFHLSGELFKLNDDLLKKFSVPLPHCIRLVPKDIVKFNHGKVGVDSMSSYIASVEVRLRNLPAISVLWIRLFLMMLINGFQITKALNYGSELTMNAEDIDLFRKHLAHDLSFDQFIDNYERHLGEVYGSATMNQGLKFASETVGNEELNIGAITFHGIRAHRKDKVDFYNSQLGQNIRFISSVNCPHTPWWLDSNHRRKCFVCSEKSRFICVRCKVPLCIPSMKAVNKETKSTKKKKRKVLHEQEDQDDEHESEQEHEQTNMEVHHEGHVVVNREVVAGSCWLPFPTMEDLTAACSP